MEREKTGIKKVDEMIQSGLPRGSITGLSGPPGVGKSIFSLHFLLEGARSGQKCVYINLEEPRTNISHMISQFSFANEFMKFVEEGRIIIKCYDYSEYEKIYLLLIKEIKEDRSINRLVIDSFNCFFAAIGSFPESQSQSPSSEANIRRKIDEIFSMLRRKELTSLLILEMQSSQNGFYYNIPYLVDGLINLEFLELGTIERRIFIPKMRWTDQYKESMHYEIGGNGIEIMKE